MKTTGMALTVLCGFVFTGSTIAANTPSTAKKAPAATVATTKSEKKLTETKVESNVDLVKKALEELYGAGNSSNLYQYFDLTYNNHDLAPNQIAGLDGIKESVTSLRTAVPDLKLKITESFEGGDKVTVRGVLNGTFIAPYHGRPPSLRPVSINFIDIYRLKDGKITDRWGMIDEGAMTATMAPEAYSSTGTIAPPPLGSNSSLVAPVPSSSTSKPGVAQHSSTKAPIDKLKLTKSPKKPAEKASSATPTPKETKP